MPTTGNEQRYRRDNTTAFKTRPIIPHMAQMLQAPGTREPLFRHDLRTAIICLPGFPFSFNRIYPVVEPSTIDDITPL